MMTSMFGELADLKKNEETFTLKSSKLISAIAKVLKAQDSHDYKLIA